MDKEKLGPLLGRQIATAFIFQGCKCIGIDPRRVRSVQNMKTHAEDEGKSEKFQNFIAGVGMKLGDLQDLVDTVKSAGNDVAHLKGVDVKDAKDLSEMVKNTELTIFLRDDIEFMLQALIYANKTAGGNMPILMDQLPP